MALKPLNLTSLYRYAEQGGGKGITDVVMAYSLGKNGTIRVEGEMIEDVMRDITSRTSPFFAKYAIERLVKNGKIQIVYNDTLRLTNAVLFFRKREGSKEVVVVNITNFSSMRQDGTIKINSNDFYAILLTAAFSLTLDSSIMSYTRDAYVMYARLFTNVISSLASYMDNVKKEKIQYLATNFFLYNVYGPDRAFVNPMKSTLRYNSKETMMALETKFPMYTENSAYESLETFIQAIATAFPEMKQLTLKNFVDRWCKAYGSAALFAPEHIPYFFFMIIATACMSDTINVRKISTEIQTNLTGMYKRIEQQVDEYAN
jgi:hypothetical protein